MKKVTLLSIVLILLAVSVVPVMAAGSSKSHGNGNGVSAGQGNSAGNQDQTRQQDRNGNGNNSTKGNGNHGNTRMRTPFYLQGTIKSIGDANTLTVTLVHGNARVKQYIGKDLIIKVTDATLIFKLTQGDETEGTADQTVASGTNEGETPANRVPIKFGELEAGQKVAIHGNLVNGVYTATLITEYIQTPLGESIGENP